MQKLYNRAAKKARKERYVYFTNSTYMSPSLQSAKSLLVAALLAQRQIAVTLFDFAGNGKFVQAARDGAARMSPFLALRLIFPPDADALENYVASVGTEIYFLRNVERQDTFMSPLVVLALSAASRFSGTSTVIPRYFPSGLTPIKSCPNSCRKPSV